MSHAVDCLARSTAHNLWSSQTVFRLLIYAVDAQITDPSNIHDRNYNSDGISPDSFYGKPKTERNNKRHSTAAYYTDARNHNVFVSFGDGISRPDISKQLMLYRRPSPWGTPPEAIPSTGGSAKRTARRGQEVVAIKRGKVQMAALEKLQGEAVRRRQTTDSNTISTSATDESSSRGQKRNPFARRLPSHDRGAGTSSDALACSPPSPFRQTRP